MLRRMRSDRSFGRTGEGGGGGGGESDRSWPRAWPECEQQPSFATRGISRLEVASEYLLPDYPQLFSFDPPRAFIVSHRFLLGWGPCRTRGRQLNLERSGAIPNVALEHRAT